jgi:SAM-dependent methyltransferase
MIEEELTGTVRERAPSDPPSNTSESAPNAIHRVRALLYRAVRSATKHGPRHTLSWGWVHLNEQYYERTLGVRTARDDAFNAATYTGKTELGQYEPLPYTLVRTIVGEVIARVGKRLEREVFLDYGCGMGRVVLMAARHPFKRVIGIELFDELLTLAQRNAAAAKPHLRSEVELHVADAVRFVVPDDVTVVHLFNPFRGSVMTETQARIREFRRLRRNEFARLRTLSTRLGTTAPDLGGWRLYACATRRNESPASPVERPHLSTRAAWRIEWRSALYDEARQDPPADNIAPASPDFPFASSHLSNRLHPKIPGE